jgi:hypothetical protein
MDCDKRIFPHLRIPRIMEQAMEYLIMHGCGQEYAVACSLLKRYRRFDVLAVPSCFLHSFVCSLF